MIDGARNIVSCDRCCFAKACLVFEQETSHALYAVCFDSCASLDDGRVDAPCVVVARVDLWLRQLQTHAALQNLQRVKDGEHPFVDRRLGVLAAEFCSQMVAHKEAYLYRSKHFRVSIHGRIAVESVSHFD